MVGGRKSARSRSVHAASGAQAVRRDVAAESQKKGKLLEQLVKLLESALADRDCAITIRHRLPDRATGLRREVDIYIEERLRGELRKTIIECRHHRALVNLTYVEQVVTKRADLGSLHTCIVSRSGFTKGALAKAKHHGIVLSTLAEVQNPLWPKWLAGGVAGYEWQRYARWLSLHPLSTHAEPITITLTKELREANDDSLVFLNEAGNPRESASSLIRSAILQMERECWDKGDVSSKTNVTLNIRFQKNLFIRFEERMVEIVGLQVQLEIGFEPVSLPMTFNQYRDASTLQTKAEAVHTSLADGTLVTLISEPMAGKQLLSIVPPEGCEGFEGEVIIVGENVEGKPLVAHIKITKPATTS
jgi:hypothetical protein